MLFSFFSNLGSKVRNRVLFEVGKRVLFKVAKRVLFILFFISNLGFKVGKRVLFKVGKRVLCLQLLGQELVYKYVCMYIRMYV